MPADCRASDRGEGDDESSSSMMLRLSPAAVFSANRISSVPFISVFGRFAAHHTEERAGVELGSRFDILALECYLRQIEVQVLIGQRLIPPLTQ